MKTTNTIPARRAPLALLIAAALAAIAPAAQASPRCALADLVQRSAIRELCPASGGLARFSVGSKWGFVDLDGRVIIAPQFDEVEDFSEGYATALVDGKWGMIDKQGNWVVKPTFQQIESMSGGLAAAGAGDKEGYIDATGKWVIPAQFDDVEPFAGNVAVVRQELRFMLIDKAGRIVKRFPENVSLFHGRGKMGMFEAKVEVPAYFANADGRRQPIPAQAADFTYADQHFVASTTVKRGDEEVKLHGLMNMAGKWVIPARFRELEPFGGKVAIASPDTTENKKGLIDRSGAFVVQPVYMHLRRGDDGFFRGQLHASDERIDIFDAAGKLVFTFECSEGDLKPGIGGLLVLAGCGKTSLALPNGKVLTTMAGEVEVQSYGNHILLVRDNSRDENRALAFELYDSKGKRLAASDPSHKVYGQGYDYVALTPSAASGHSSAGDLPIALFAQYEPSSVTILTRDHKLITRPDWRHESEIHAYAIRHDSADMEGPLVMSSEAGFGAVDTNGNWVVPPKYSRLTPFEHGMAFATLDGERLVVDTTGKTYPFPEGGYRFSQSAFMTLSGETDEGIMTVDLRTGAVTKKKMPEGWSGNTAGGLTPVEQDRKWGLMNARHEWVLKPAFDEEPKPVLKGEELAGWITTVNIELPTEVDSLHGLLDPRGREIIKPRYTDLGLNEASGLLMASENDYLRSVLDTSGKVLIAPVHAELSYRGDGWFTVKPAEQQGLVDERGEWVVKPSRFPFELKSYDDKPMPPYAMFYGALDKELMDMRGRISTRSAPLDLGVPDQSQWWWHEAPRGGNGTVFYGFDFKPRVRLPGATSASHFSEQRIAFRSTDDKHAGKLGLADDKGNVLGMYEAEEIGEMNEGMARLTKMVPRTPAGKGRQKARERDYVGKVGYLNHAGKLTVPAVFDAGSDFAEQRAVVVSKGGLAMIDTAGKIVLQGSWQCGRTPVLLDEKKKVVWPEEAKGVTNCKR